jgi:hypothetical protein
MLTLFLSVYRVLTRRRRPVVGSLVGDTVTGALLGDTVTGALVGAIVTGAVVGKL